MVLYLDIILFMNFVVNYCFLELIYILFNEKIKTFRLILSSITSILLLFFFFTNYQIFNIVKIIGGMLIVLIGIKFVNCLKYIVMVSMYYILEFAFIGILQVFNVKGMMGLIFLLIVCLLLLICSKKKNIFKTNTYKVIIEIDNRNIELKAFLDTGNVAMCNSLPIIFIDDRYFISNLKIEKEVIIKTINNEEIVKCYKPKKVYIYEGNKKIEKDCLIAFARLENTECLLNNLMFC